MRRQTILLAAALAVITPSAALTENRTAAREAALAIQTPKSPMTDRLILKIEDAKTASSATAPVDEASLLFELAEARKLRQAAAPDASQRIDMDTNARAPSGGDATTPAAATADAADSTAPGTADFTPHHGVSPEHKFHEDRDRVSLNVAPVTAPRYRDGDWETLRAGNTAHDADVSGVAVGLSFQLN